MVLAGDSRIPQTGTHTHNPQRTITTRASLREGARPYTSIMRARSGAGEGRREATTKYAMGSCFPSITWMLLLGIFDS